MRPCTAFQQRIAKIGPSSNEGLKYRDIEIVKFEYGKCCAHFFRGSIYMLEPVWYFFKKFLILVHCGVPKAFSSMSLVLSKSIEQRYIIHAEKIIYLYVL